MDVSSVGIPAQLMNDLVKKQIFGRVKAHLYSIEWQKRGLPHVHILLWMAHKVTAEFVDKTVCAEIPNKEKDPKLYDIVTRCMIHGPCIGFDENQPCCHSHKKKYNISLDIINKNVSANL